MPGRARLKTTKAKKPPRTSATKASPNPNPNPHLAVAEDVLAQTLAAGGWVDEHEVDAAAAAGARFVDHHVLRAACACREDVVDRVTGKIRNRKDAPKEEKKAPK